MKIYTDGLDGHCARSYAYSAEKMPDITEELNRIKGATQVAEVRYKNGTVKYYNVDSLEYQQLVKGVK